MSISRHQAITVINPDLTAPEQILILIRRFVFYPALSHHPAELHSVHVAKVYIGPNDFATIGRSRGCAHNYLHPAGRIIEEVHAFVHPVAIEAACARPYPWMPGQARSFYRQDQPVEPRIDGALIWFGGRRIGLR